MLLQLQQHLLLQRLTPGQLLQLLLTELHLLLLQQAPPEALEAPPELPSGLAVQQQQQQQPLLLLLLLRGRGVLRQCRFP